ncbi:MAG: hypothetical protein ABWY09_09335 [Stenotrophomonas maltophilia]
MSDRKLPKLNDLDALSSEESEIALGARRRILESMKPRFDATFGMGSMLRAMQPAIGPAIAAVGHLGRVSATFEAIGASLAKEPARLRERIRVLVHQGWFIDPEMPISLVRDLAEAFDNGNLQEAEEALVDYYRTSADAVIKRVCDQNPLRAEIMTQAFAAHQAGHYGLSVPAFLIQADGLAGEHHDGRQLFSKVPARSVGAVANSAAEGSSEWLFLSAYAESSPFSKNTNELGEGFTGLNRHGVLHGAIVNYATEINSLRALSALGYASFVMSPNLARDA